MLNQFKENDILYLINVYTSDIVAIITSNYNKFFIKIKKILLSED